MTDAEFWQGFADRLKPYLGTATPVVPPPVTPPPVVTPPVTPAPVLTPPTPGYDGYVGGLGYTYISNLTAEDGCFFLDTKDSFNWKQWLIGDANQVMNLIQFAQQNGRARYRQDVYIARPGTLAKIWNKYH
jgi:hypothetical protein